MNNDLNNETPINLDIQTPDCKSNELDTNCSARKKGTVKNFTQLSLNALEIMHNDLELEMSVGELAKCQSSYRLQKRNDVSTDEIYFIDAMISSRRTLASRLAPSELLTNDPHIAATYADMMRKCTSLDVWGDSPLSINVETLLQLGSDYAKYAGRKPSYFTAQEGFEFSNVISRSALSIAPASFVDPQPLKNARSSALCSINTKHQITPCVKNMNGKKTSIAFLLPIDDVPLTNEKITTLLSQNRLKRALVGYGTLEDSLTLSLQRLLGNSGIKIEFGNLCSLGVTEFFEIEEAFSGLPFIAYHSKFEKDIKNATTSLGIRMIVFASAQKLSSLTVCKSGSVLFNTPLSHLENLFPKKLMSAKIPPQVLDLQSLDINSSTVLDDVEGDTVTVGELWVSSAHSNLENGYFSTLYSILGAVSKLICRGACLSDISVSYRLSSNYPENDEKFGELLSLILGAYRAHAELSLPASKSELKLLTDTDEDFLVFAFGKSNKLNISTNLFSIDKAPTYISIPRIDENGLVDFNELRDIWRFISDEENKVIYARALCAESPSDVLGAPCNIDEKLPIAFIIQCANEMDVPHSTPIKSTDLT